ncbi:uncharacterized protein LOC111246749 isoform X3 [Varroa destructor]|uniref:Uncharacterized protein n=1 Tax=Varroa destructor TaxID=109461 RepID=A0A7M7M6A0_VARDE|nr:uncharacterized protein LOC111246749 isoform X3 [Varroa destructor]
MSTQYTLLSDFSGDSSPIRRPFISFIAVVCFVAFFVLYMDFIPMVITDPNIMEPNAISGQLRTRNFTSTFTTTVSSVKRLQEADTTTSQISVRLALSSAEAGTDIAGGNSILPHTEFSISNNTTGEITAVEITAQTAITIDDAPVPTNIYNSSDADAVYNKYAIYTARCRIPDYDYNEQTIMKKYFSNTPKMCPADAKPFVFYPKIDLKGFSCIAFDQNTFDKYYKANFSKWNCTYKETFRNPKYQAKKNIVELYGYNKIGLNSAPNQIPLLTGIQYYPAPGLRSRIDNTYFDNVTRFLWNDYEERGYRTMFYEEQWHYGLFVYPSLKGFKQVPTTYWSRPMMQAVDKSTLKASGYSWCIGPDFPAKHYLDYTYNTMKILGEDRPLFSYSWLSETAHDDINGGHRIDKYFEDFFAKMDRDGILNRTAVFFISDHGFRFGSFRTTTQGRYEDTLPYGFILLPESYYNENPKALANIKANSRRLVTVYDLHATLLELADMWSEGRVTRTANGYSLISNVIPDDRTCEHANIGFQYCSCFESQPYDRKGRLATSFAQFVLDSINHIVEKNNATLKCHEWTLRDIDDLTRLSEGELWTDIFKISLSTKPSAQFEVAGKFIQNANKIGGVEWKLVADIDRIDWFSSHAKCVKGSSYERYCYCRE